MRGPRRLLIPAIQVSLLVAVLVAWQLAVDHGAMSVLQWSRPTDIRDRIVEWERTDQLWPNVSHTLSALLVAYVAAVIIGGLVGFLTGVSHWFRAFLEPFLVLANSTPRTALIPVFIVILGFSSNVRVLFVFSTVVFLIIIDVGNAVREVSADVLTHTRLLGAGPMAVLRHAYIPAAAFRLLASARVAIGYAFSAAIVAEFFGTIGGVGSLLVHSQESFDAAGLYASIAVMIVMAVLLDTGLRVVERRSSRWRDPGPAPSVAR